MPMPMPLPLLTTGTRPKNTLPRIHNSPSSGRTRTPPPPRRVLIPSRLANMRWGPSCAAALRSPARGSETNAEPDAKPPPPPSFAAAPKGITAYVLGGQCLVFISQTQSQCFRLFLPFPTNCQKSWGASEHFNSNVSGYMPIRAVNLGPAPGRLLFGASHIRDARLEASLGSEPGGVPPPTCPHSHCSVSCESPELSPVGPGPCMQAAGCGQRHKWTARCWRPATPTVGHGQG